MKYKFNSSFIEIIQFFANMMDGLEDEEPNTIEVNITGNMKRAEVVEEILRQIREMEGQE